jgi:formylglycine-generating enzyme required for sulfatase activity
MTATATPDIVIIPEGSFLMGSEQEQENERPCHRVWLDRFGIGKFSVTNKEYKLFLEATQMSAPPFWADPIFSEPRQPVVGVNWDDALAYCRWLSDRTDGEFRLPTEAEWERAARGGREGALYPWGDEPPWEKPYSGCDSKTGGPAHVGINEPNDFGLYDMSEGVHEWCSDYYDYHYYRYSPERNPQGPSSGERRASRGGSWRHRIKFSRCAARSSLPPSFKYADYGFRIAQTLR